MYVGEYRPVLSPPSGGRAAEKGRGRGAIQPGQFASCLLPAHASTGAAPVVVQQLHLSFQLSSYSNLLGWPAWGQPHLAPPAWQKFFRADRLWLSDNHESCCR
jgi:hypothetical protein